jgi:Na+/H+ antiporter NhaD/arsenite permease-like protein
VTVGRFKKKWFSSITGESCVATARRGTVELYEPWIGAVVSGELQGCAGLILALSDPKQLIDWPVIYVDFFSWLAPRSVRSLPSTLWMPLWTFNAPRSKAPGDRQNSLPSRTSRRHSLHHTGRSTVLRVFLLIKAEECEERPQTWVAISTSRNHGIPCS